MNTSVQVPLREESVQLLFLFCHNEPLALWYSSLCIQLLHCTAATPLKSILQTKIILVWMMDNVIKHSLHWIYCKYHADSNWKNNYEVYIVNCCFCTLGPMLDISVFVFVCFAEVIQANTTQVSFISRASVYPLCRVHTSRDKPAVKLRDLFLYKAPSAHDTYRRIQCNDLNISHFSVFLWRVASVWRSECTQWKRLGRGRTLLSSTALTYFYWRLYEDYC